jgi:hypothetical protein
VRTIRASSSTRFVMRYWDTWMRPRLRANAFSISAVAPGPRRWCWRDSCRRARSSASSWRKKSCDSRGCAPSTWGEAACKSSARPPAIRYVIFSAVFEHLLPDERPMLLQKIWQTVKPGGILFLNQTPYRYSPVDTHTTGLPLINYLPDSLALWAARRFSNQVRPHEDWNTLLRRGIRGGTVPEVLAILSKSGKPVLLRPAKRVGDRIDLWYGTLSPRYGWIKKSYWIALKAVKAISGVEVPPTLMLAIRKDA